MHHGNVCSAVGRSVTRHLYTVTICLWPYVTNDIKRQYGPPISPNKVRIFAVSSGILVSHDDIKTNCLNKRQVVLKPA